MLTESVDLGLWWKPLGAAADAARKLTIGVGEYAEPNLSADGTRLVATLIDSRQALISIPAGPSEFAVDRALTLTGDTGDVAPAVSSDGRRLVFSSTRSGNRNLWIARVDGTEPRPLTSGDAIDDWPVFSPDGGQIAFVSDRGGDRGIWLINADGGSLRLVAKAAVLDTISWSRDGQRIVYAEPGDEAPRLSVVTAGSGRVTPPPTPGPASGPVWSPTSDIIAYIETRPAVNGPTTTRCTVRRWCRECAADSGVSPSEHRNKSACMGTKRSLTGGWRQRGQRAECGVGCRAGQRRSDPQGHRVSDRHTDPRIGVVARW